MKKLLLFLAAVSSVPAMASPTIEIPHSATGLYSITNYNSMNVVNAGPLRCPPRAACAPRSVAVVSVPLNGCVDDLGPVTYSVKRLKSGMVRITASVLAFADQGSTRVRCSARNMKTFSIPLGTGYLNNTNVTLELLNSTADNYTRD